MFGFTTLCVSFLVSLALASPLARRDVWDPKITSPNANTVWPAGTVQTVTWDTSDKPAQVTNLNGKVILGFGGEGNTSLNLDFDHPLAQNFLLTDGKVQITVPDVSPRTDYLIVLMGDSGNESPLFSIVAVSSSTGRAVASSDSVTATPIPITGGPSVTPSPPIATSGEFSTTTPSDSVTTTTTPISTSTSTSTSVITTSTAPSNSTSTSASTTSSASVAGASPSTSDAWSIYHIHSMKGLTAVVTVLIMIFI